MRGSSIRRSRGLSSVVVGALLLGLVGGAVGIHRALLPNGKVVIADFHGDARPIATTAAPDARSRRALPYRIFDAFVDDAEMPA